MPSNDSTEKKGYGWLVILMIGAFFTVLSTTLMSNVTPIVMTEFNVSATAAQWLTTIYMLTAGIIIPTSAFLMSKYATRTLFLTCIAVFTIGTMLGGFAPNFAVLLIARVVQALGASLIMPLLMNIVFKAFPEEKRGKAMGLFGLVLIFAPAIGPTLAGFILKIASWPALFHLVWPVTLIVFLFAYIKLEKDKETQPGKIDILSVILSIIGFGGTIYGFSSAGKSGWGDSIVITSLVIGILGIAGFIVRQLRMKTPMLNFRIFSKGQFTLSIIVFCTIIFAMYSVMIPVPVYLQTVRGMSPLESGLIMMPGSILMGLLMPVNGTLYDKFGFKPLLWIGFPLMIIASIMLSNFTLETSFAFVCIAYILRMVGVGIVQVPMQTNALNALSENEVTHGSAMASMLQQVAGAISTSLIVSIISSRAASHGKTFMATAMQEGKVITESMKGKISLEAMVAGNNDAFLMSIVVALTGLIIGLFIKNHKVGRKSHH
ncbi:MAG: transporter [Paenibacillaceae bacterium]|nr:transporter [Paenibacillaceae bacterium]